MSEDNTNRIPLPVFAIRFRALILALGESAQPVWWKTEFMSETGLRFLERLYPRTPFRAAVHAAGTAACHVHDRAVGRVGVYHLFRLPEFLEAEIYAIPSSANEEFFSRFRECLGRQDNLLEMISKLCIVEKPTSIDAGPKRIGTESDATTFEALGGAAAIYYEAFKKGKPTFPYFASEQNRTKH